MRRTGWGFAAAVLLLAAAGQAGERRNIPKPKTPPPPAEYKEDVPARRARFEAGPPPFLFSVTDPASGRTGYVQGEPAYATESLYPVHPALQRALDAVDALIVPQVGELSGAAEDNVFWMAEEMAERGEWLPKVIEADGAYTLADPEARIRVWTDASPRLAVDALVYAKRLNKAFRLVMPRAAAVPRRPWSYFWDGRYSFLPRLVERWFMAYLGCRPDPDYDLVIRIYKGNANFPYVFYTGFEELPGYFCAAGTTAYVQMTLMEPGDPGLGLAMRPETRKVIRHELGHAFLFGGPSLLREHSFMHEGWASYFTDVNIREGDPRATAAGLYDPRPLMQWLEGEEKPWPDPAESIRDAPLAWLWYERGESHYLTYDAGQAFAAFMMADPGRARRYDAAWARVLERGGALFSQKALAALAPAFRAWREEKGKAPTKDVLPLPEHTEWLYANVPAEYLPPKGKKLPDMIGFLYRVRYNALRKEAVKYADQMFSNVRFDIDEFEKWPPLAIIALMESILTTSYRTGTDPLHLWLAREGERRGKLLGTLGWPNIYNDVFPVYLEQRRRMTVTEEKAAFEQKLLLMIQLALDGTESSTSLVWKQYDDWFNNNPSFLSPDERCEGFFKTRYQSEWRRRVMTPVYARQMREAFAGGRTPLLVVDMDFLAALPDNLRDALAKEGFVVSPVAATPSASAPDPAD